jgi:hypothetical protein
MTPAERAELIASVLSDADALWAVRTSKVRVLGPWEKAESEARRVSIYEGWWRLNTRGEPVVTVVPSPPMTEPQWYEYTRYTYITEDGEPYTDEDEFEESMEQYRREKEIWKPWTVSFDKNGYGEKVYAETLEEAKATADRLLKEKGVLLRNEHLELPESPKRLTRLVLSTED